MRGACENRVNDARPSAEVRTRRCGSAVATADAMKLMKHLAAASLCFMIMTVTSLVAAPPPGKGRNAGPAPAAPTMVRTTSTNVDIHFSAGNVRVIREHYASRYRQLPPG